MARCVNCCVRPACLADCTPAPLRTGRLIGWLLAILGVLLPIPDVGLLPAFSQEVAVAEDEPAAIESREVSLPGLREPVEIAIDQWGIAHITAQNEHDLFFAQGYSAASRRMFQFELWRRQATGTVAEILGRRELKRDIGARLLRYRGDLTEEMNHYHPRGAEIITAFTAGINARIEEVLQEPELLPIEFRLLGILPKPWTPDVVISRHQGLVHNLTQELDLGRSVSLLGAERVRELVDFHPGEPELALDPAIDGELLFADILELYRLARQPIQFRPMDVVLAARETARLPELPPTGPLGELTREDRINWRDVGSNNWVVSGSRTASGKPLVVNDPHRVLHVPSLRYFVHLKAPGWNVIGGGEPVLPGVAIGHNEHGGWGLTIYRIDAEDLYVYEIDPENPLRYRYQDGWEEMTTVSETISVKDEEDVQVELHYTRHGPVLYRHEEQHRAYALRAGWLEKGASPYLASLRMDTARNWKEFREACSYSRLPGLNMVWADKHGDIGWQVVGISPLRPNWSGLVPVPGDGRYEWESYLPIPQLPHVHNPRQGFWNTSNEAIVPRNYPHRNAVGWTWSDPYRGRRVREVLAGSRKHTVAGMAELQLDELSIPARELTPLLREILKKDIAFGPHLKLFADWDYQLRAESAAAALYVMFERKLEDRLRELLVPEEARKYLPELSMRNSIAWLKNPGKQFGPDPVAQRDTLIRESFGEAVQELTDRLGNNPARWQYGSEKYKHALIQHPLSRALKEDYRRLLDIGPLPRGGNGYTVNNTGRPDRQPTGATFRVAIDTADWDRSLATSTPGQSGDPASPHYRDLFAPWAAGDHFPLLYTPEKIAEATRQRLQLKPTR